MLDIKTVVGHLANGTLGENLCLICLKPLEDSCENIFTKICKEDDEFCVADALGICGMEFSEYDNYNVCVQCFVKASSALRFYIKVKKTKEMLEFYTNQLLESIDNVNIPDESSKALCISLPILHFPEFNFSLKSIGRKDNIVKDSEQKPLKKKEDEDDNVVLIIKDGVPSYYKFENGELVQISEKERDSYNKMLKLSKKREKTGYKKRVPLKEHSCSRCLAKYIFIKRLKHHMKVDHDVDLYVCKICKLTTEDKQEYHDHMKKHTNVYQCAECSRIFRRRSKIISHLQAHERHKVNELVHICELCGTILDSEEQLSEHKQRKHEKKYTCHYCGKMYKGEIPFDRHIRKHETFMLKNNELPPNLRPKQTTRKMCSTCGKDFVDQRALLWHQRLHTNERPYVCDICGKGFVSLNRRNQHATCAHSAPTKGCPLCPALFHFRSMVNTHIKQVHLQTNKRRNKPVKQRNVFWRTEAVPIQELSLSIQNELLQMQTQKNLNNYSQLQFSPMESTPR